MNFILSSAFAFDYNYFSRSLSYSIPLYQAISHKLYKLVDWDRIEGGDYAVVNPQDPAEILYLSERDYIVQIRVSMTQNHRLVTLATPMSSRPVVPVSTVVASPVPASTPAASVPPAQVPPVPNGTVPVAPVAPVSTPVDPEAPVASGSSPSTPKVGTPEPVVTGKTATSGNGVPPRGNGQAGNGTSSSKEEQQGSDPSSSADTSSFFSKKSPPRGWGDLRSSFRAMFGTSFRWVKKSTRIPGEKAVVENMAVVTEGNLLGLFGTWAYHLWSKIEGLRSSKKHRHEVRLFVEYLLTLFRRHGATHLIARLKIYLFVVNSFIAGQKLETTEQLGFRVRLSHGLPKCLPASVRSRIRNKDTSTIRIWSSIFYIYKAISGEHEAPSFDTIVSESPTHTNGWALSFPHFEKFGEEFRTILLGWGVKPVDEPKGLIPTSLFSSGASGPNYKYSLASLPMDTLYWIGRGWTKSNPLRAYMLAIKDSEGVKGFETYGEELVQKWFSRPPQPHKPGPSTAFRPPQPFWVEFGAGPDYSTIPTNGSVPDHFLLKGSATKHANAKIVKPLGGKLAALKEAAGKVRIIAIVDAWSQTYLTPVHDYFFQILRKIPQDATFDQQGAVNKFAQKGYTDLFSYDLSAATDTIPWNLYDVIMRWILPAGVTKPWLDLLRDRDWLLPMWETVPGSKPVRLEYQGKTTVRYNRGQPMGARSSWGALAIVHHALVQFAASCVNRQPFSDYLVLGDDIVIADKDVAHWYKVICDHLGVKIGLAKSFCSAESFFNFANQSFSGATNLSPISFKEELSHEGLTSRIESLWKVVEKGVLDISKTDFLAKSLRWVLRPHTLECVEAARKKGSLHEAARRVFTLIFTSGLEGNKAFLPLEGLSGREMVMGMVNPSLSLFTMGVRPLESQTRDKRWIWATDEYLLVLIDRMVIELRRELHLRGNILREFLGQELLPDLALMKLPNQTNLHLASLSKGRGVDRWRVLSETLFGRRLSIPSEIQLWDGTRVNTDSFSLALKLYPNVLLDLAKRVLPLYNFCMFQLVKLAKEPRQVAVDAPHLLPDTLRMSIEKLETLRSRITLLMRVPAESTVARKFAVADNKIIEGLLLSDGVRVLASLKVKDHLVNPANAVPEDIRLSDALKGLYEVPAIKAGSRTANW